MTLIDQILAEKIGAWEIDGWPIGTFFLCVIAMLLSTILCGAIGIERERRGRSAGLRTHLLVGVGSCLIMIISIYGFPNFFQRDVARLAAGIITGVGFLGAGAIIHRNSGTKGLTTAATVWIVMAIGLACGSMNFILATGSTILILLVLVSFRKFETRINQKSPLLIVKAKGDYPILSRLLTVADEMSYNIRDLQIGKTDGGEVELTFYAVSHSQEFEIKTFIAKIELLEGVKEVALITIHK